MRSFISSSLFFYAILCRLTRKTSSLYAAEPLLTWKKQSQKGNITTPIKVKCTISVPTGSLKLNFFGNASQTS